MRQLGWIARQATRLIREVWRWPDRRLERQLRQNAEWCRQAREALPLSAYFEWQSGNSDATD